MMSCTRTRATSLIVVAALLVSLLTPHLPTACARHVVVLKANNGLNNNGDMVSHLAKELWSASADDDSAVRKEFSGRKLAAGNKEEAAEAKGATTPARSPPRTVQMRVAAKHGDAATEMYDMLRRDYAYKASRRRPINNGVPLQEEEP
ncbi:hypothetical protein ACP70R_009800 [Stipagrostis hirtigluma subsp. patula]